MQTTFLERDIVLSAHSQPAGAKFPAKLAYLTLGEPTNPAILLPTCYGGTLAYTSRFLWWTDDEVSQPTLSPSKYFIIVTGLLGGGESSSPSNTSAPWNGPNFPGISYEDNIRLQYELCKTLGVNKLFAYIGFSMGGQQAYHMSTLYPDFVENMVCLAGSARTSWHNWCFLEGPKHALISAADFHDGHYTSPVVKGVRAFDRVYSTWALSPEWFRQRRWEQTGCSTLQEYLDKNWSGGADANNLLAMMWTWQKGDITVYHPEDKGDLPKTLRRIKARCLIMPSRTDQYFPPEDNQEEVKHLTNGEFRCIDTVWGHLGASGISPKEDNEFMKKEIAQFLKI